MNRSKLSILATVAVAALAVAACTTQKGGGIETGTGLGKLSGVTPTSSATAFDRALFAEYSAYSRAEYNQGDYVDSDRYAARARFAAAGNTPSPQHVEGRKLPGDKVAELTSAYQRLILALNVGKATERMPADAAKAQVMFDCWIEQQEEKRESSREEKGQNLNDSLTACRNGFLAAMTKIEVPPPPVVVPAPPPPRPENFTILFDFNATALNDKAREEVAHVVARARALNAKSVVVNGYADRSGSNEYNMKLSQKREAAVRAALNAAGVNAPATGNAHGEANPAVPTADGVREAANRRVVVTINP